MKGRKPRIRLLVCDLDGTLIGPGDYGLDASKSIIEFCLDKGLRVTVATGRVFGATERYLSHFGIDEPIITNGGALISRMSEPPMYERTIDRGLALRIASELEVLGHPFYFLIGKEMYTPVTGPETEKYSGLLGYHINILDSVVDIPGAPTQIVVRVSPKKADFLLRDLKKTWLPGVSVIKSMPHLLEVQPPGVSKARAVEFLADSFGIRRTDVLTIGDGLNDLEMLMWSGMKAAVRNAHDAVKQRVDYVSGESYSEGVRDIIREFLGWQIPFGIEKANGER